MPRAPRYVATASRAPSSYGGRDPAIGVRAHERLVGEADDDRVDLGAGLERARGRPGGSTRCPIRARRCARTSTPSADERPRRRSSDTTTVTAPSIARACGVERVRDQRPPAELGELLGCGAAEPFAAPGGEDDDCDQTASSARRTSTRARCSRYSGDALRSLRRLGALGRVRGGVGRRRALRERLLDRRSRAAACCPC